jgi:hypothetical protein
MLALVRAGLPAQAQKADGSKPPAQKPLIKREVPKEQTVLDQFNLQSTDTGREERQRLELDLSKDKDTFIFGNKTTSYPTSRRPGEEFQPALPLGQSKDTYSIGIGKRF